MPFAIDYLDDGRVLEWGATADGAVATEREDYTPRFYVAPRAPEVEIDFTRLRTMYDRHPDVVATDIVALAHEEVETYDPSYYETKLVRAIESVLSPLGWDWTDIRRELAETRELAVTDFTGADED